MSPGWVLSPDALQLATILCPLATSIRLRFDCSTPNDVLSALVNLEKIIEFSAVCVTSGERTNLDFTDMIPILEKYGPTTLTFLELKVIEEVEIHVIIENCFKLEILILSGCGYVTPQMCASFSCNQYKSGTFKRLKHLFFADGDDFSWDHGVPECFWRSSLLSPGPNDDLPLQGMFLEYPRIPDQLTAKIFRREAKHTGKLPFPNLKVASLCRFNELTLEDVVAFCGLEEEKHPPIYFLRISECDLWQPEQEKLLQDRFHKNQMECQIQVDGSHEDKEFRKPYSFKIYRPR